MKSVFVKTLGCKVNTFDSHALENQFRDEGYLLVSRPEDADVTVINSCSVTAAAEREARYLLRRYRRENPQAYQVITGCYAQIESEGLRHMDEVDFVVPNEAKERLVPLVSERLASPGALAKGGEGRSKLPEGVQPVKQNRQTHFKSSLTFFDSPRSERTRVFLKIQDGCNGFCSYCQIPWSRGSSRSVNPDQVIVRVRKLLAAGAPEIVLTGIHIGDYGDDLGGVGQGQKRFLELLQRIFDEPGLGRLRISSLEPCELTEALISLLARNREKFCAHFHLPLQSGDDRILRLMNRRYTTEGYRQSVGMIRSHFPEARISADVIPGFPGENEGSFVRTKAFIRSCQLSSLHVFPYSKRPGTAALRMSGHVDPKVRKQRAALLRKLSLELGQEFDRRFLGGVHQVLWEHCHDSGRWEGKTRNYLQVLSPEGFPGRAGMESAVRLKGFLEQGKILGMPA